MKTFTITQLKADAGKIVDQVSAGEPAMIVGGSKTVVMHTLEAKTAQGRSGFYSGSEAKRRKLLADGSANEAKRA